jgi:catechol 2,3-dioxygenase-like lactoylglutathione lyase family enzyme
VDRRHGGGCHLNDDKRHEELTLDFRLELVLIPVSDVDRAKDFYTNRAGFTLEVDGRVGDRIRIVQVTPPGSACSVGFGTGFDTGLAGPDHAPMIASPGSQRGLHLVVRDIAAARDELMARGVPVTEIRHIDDGEVKPGRDPHRSNYMSFAEFSDPDGNTWLLQEVNRES